MPAPRTPPHSLHHARRLFPYAASSPPRVQRCTAQQQTTPSLSATLSSKPRSRTPRTRASAGCARSRCVARTSTMLAARPHACWSHWSSSDQYGAPWLPDPTRAEPHFSTGVRSPVASRSHAW
eukprot:1127742-Prymnesium_polylepis.1